MRSITVSEAKGKMCPFMSVPCMTGNCMAWVYANNARGKTEEERFGKCMRLPTQKNDPGREIRVISALEENGRRSGRKMDVEVEQ